MIREVAVSAPGKTILMGEHAAVYGHPALVAALDLRMTVAVRAGSGAGVRLDMPALGWAGDVSWDAILALAEARRAQWTDAFERGDGTGFSPVRAPHELALLAIAEAAASPGSRARPGLTVRIDSDIPPGSGCGSSAALSVAIVGAILRALGAPHDDATIARRALAVERQQHGRPSGVDVEAVLRGGLLWCRRGADGTTLREELALPAGRLAPFRLYHSGAPAETTGEMVAWVRGLERRDPLAVRDALAAIDGATHELLRALEGGAVDALVPLVRRCEGGLESLEVVPGRIASEFRAIERAGGAAKISGAGGRTGAGAGLVLVVHPDDLWHERFALPAGWTPLSAALGAPGLREEVAA
jgi:mevalonate kinase